LRAQWRRLQLPETQRVPFPIFVVRASYFLFTDGIAR